MSKRQMIMILGAVVILVALFSGFPQQWDTAIYVILGILIVAAAYLMKPIHSPVKPSAPYIEHIPAEKPAEKVESPTTTDQ